MDEDLKRLLEEMRQENAAAHAQTRAELRQENAAAHAETRAELRQENAAAHAETRQHTDTIAAQIRQENAAAHAETRRHFEVVAEATHHEIQLVAEKVVRVEEKLDSEAADIRAEMRRGFGDTQAMIRFSHSELDRRVRTLEESNRTLEEGMADLQARVERLESSPH
jgi:hypothetical protein